ncbi:cadmium resistance protein CadD (predicted permease) [Amycolatopsis umgeniensis]|uniref:Cadmium resistance protein CadD (Predicted permease) n=1 Tax=Amycolatopsis umgeniensis TaxID=336628 RepID=A0A841B514_9PSEU|nr:cadmium resistance protein CadD (predicted permease) [Amycolatopsis umgeniensis]
MLPEAVLPWLGLVPLLLGLRAAWRAWRERGEEDEGPDVGPGVLAVAGVIFANGGDNIGVYVPVFANTDTGGLIVYAAVFLAVWCAAGRYFATRPIPIVLVAIGLLILLRA